MCYDDRIMGANIEINPNDEVLAQAGFKYYCYKDTRLARQFLPTSEEPQTQEIAVPWGDTLIAKKGDYIVSDAKDPSNSWPVAKEIFEQTHEEKVPGSGIFKKTAIIALVPLTEFTEGNPDQLVTIHSLEGEYTVRAGDFHLARGIKQEIWAYPSENIPKNLVALD